MKYFTKSFLLFTIILMSCVKQEKNELTMQEEVYKTTMQHLIEDVWNNQNLEIIPKVFTIQKEYIQPTFDAFPDIKHGYDMLLIDGDKIAMSFYGEGTHKKAYDGIPATNKVLKYRGMAFFRMEGNRIAEVWTHSNWATKFNALTQ